MRIRMMSSWKGHVTTVVAFIVASWGGLVVQSSRADAPPERYEVTAETVRDTRTGLTWQRGVPAGGYTQADAVDYCPELSLAGFGDWRLPRISELLTLVDPTRADPSIDLNAFPATHSTWFWTSSVSVGFGVWWVDFNDGSSSYTSSVTATGSVRCVR